MVRNAIILAGGFGTRLAKIMGDKPKPLAEVGGKPILERQIEQLLYHGVDKIRLSLHHKADQIISFCESKWPGKLQYLVEEKPLGTGGGIKFASAGLSEPFLVLNGDTLSDMALDKFMQSRPNTIMCTHLEDTRGLGLLDVKEGKISAFREKPSEKISGFVNCGVYLLEPAAFDGISQESFMIEKEVFPRLAQEGSLNAYVHKGYWIDAGTEESYKRANEEIGMWVKEI